MTQTSYLGDKPVNRIGFGAMQLAGPGVFGPPRDPDAARAVLRRAIELGVDHIDTSQYYGPDVVNELIRETLHPYPEGLKLVTKVGARRDAEGGVAARTQPPAELRAGVEDNLRSLQVERMDLVNLRAARRRHAARRSRSPSSSATLEDLREEGKLDLIGVSNVTRDERRAGLELVDLAEVQNSYSILDRDAEPLLDLCRERESRSCRSSRSARRSRAARPSSPRTRRSPRWRERHGATPTQVALAWLLARYDRMLLIPGTSSVAHLEENMAAGDVELDAEDLAQLDAVQPPVSASPDHR